MDLCNISHSSFQALTAGGFRNLQRNVSDRSPPSVYHTQCPLSILTRGDKAWFRNSRQLPREAPGTPEMPTRGPSWCRPERLSFRVWPRPVPAHRDGLSQTPFLRYLFWDSTVGQEEVGEFGVFFFKPKDVNDQVPPAVRLSTFPSV